MIELKQVTKRYGAVEAIRDISFTAPRGQIVGLLGQNGAGKTTTLNILTGYMPPTSGQVLVDGEDVRQLRLSSLRKNVGIVQQDVFLFAGTVRSNIVLRDERITEEEILAACRYVDNLPGN